MDYGIGSFSGTEYTDTVTLGPGLVIKKQSIGVANKTDGFDDLDGILGLGPVALTENVVSNKNTVPTVADNLFHAGKIASETLGIFYRPIINGSGSGELTWGGVDMTKIEGKVNYVPITKSSPANNYWGVDQSVMYNGKTILSHTAGTCSVKHMHLRIQ